MNIRVARAEDAADVARVYVDSWNAGLAGLVPGRELTDGLIERWRSDLAAGRLHAWWIAEVDGVIVGFAGIGPCRDPIDPSFGELDTIAVEPASWRRGLGRALMNVAVEQLASDGYRTGVLWTPAHYDRGIAFYEATGWRRNGGIRDDGRQVRFVRDLTTSLNTTS